ncbi:adenosine monophosphate-protein transferase [Candidatus Micrarchaeota archaeon]|nr:adenosine monophosphate-protein transferase [Candidatus Micrarchaeota archaeon]MBD3417424.1 adenosine monophosphate-protein transferase [Candidatus Micrarchaeota archaeon]
MMVEFELVDVEIPEGTNVVLGQSHFIKTVEDLYETIAESGMSIKFGLAFCEASMKRLVRSDGNDPELVKHAEKEALKVGAGHCFLVFLQEGFPINVVNRIQGVSEVTTLYAATANPLKVVIAKEGEQRGIMGVLDGLKPLGVEGEEDKGERREFLRKIGYKR